MTPRRRKRIVLLLVSALVMLGGCRGKEPVPASEYAQQLIAEFNAGNGNARIPIRDYAAPGPAPAWKCSYSVMDEQFELEEAGRDEYILRTTYTEYVSIENASSPEAARSLTEFETADSLQAVTHLFRRNGVWTVDTQSDVFSVREQEWTRRSLFRMEINTN